MGYALLSELAGRPAWEPSLERAPTIACDKPAAKSPVSTLSPTERAWYPGATPRLPAPPELGEGAAPSTLSVLWPGSR